MNATTGKKTGIALEQEVCIDLPGEVVQCWRSRDKIKVILRKHRDIFFDINFKTGMTYTVQSDREFYSPREKKLLKHIGFRDGEQLNLWVGREFKGKLTLKSNEKTIGIYEVNQFDPRVYGVDPKTKPEPLMIILGQTNFPDSFQCTGRDPFGIDTAHQLFRTPFDKKVSMLKDFGTEIDYRLTNQQPEVEQYVAVTEAQRHELQPQILEQLRDGGAVTGSPSQIFAVPRKGKEGSSLYAALGTAAAYISGNEFWTSTWLKESAGYIHENFRALDKITMTVRVEERVKGRYRVAFRGNR